MLYKVVESEFSYKGSEELIYLHPGTYKFEVWGAQGGSGTDGGKGGYTAGIITIDKAVNAYIYVGGKGNELTGGWNGGGRGGEGSFHQLSETMCSNGGGGGGSTDIRIGSKDVNHRIIVAGGGGGTCGNGWSPGGSGGGISGGYAYAPKTNKSVKGGSQTEGDILNGQSAVNSCDGDDGSEGNGGGGGGYRGGFAYQSCGVFTNVGGGGGSSYISGHPECEKNTEYVFTNITVQQNVQTGDGKAKITKIVKEPTHLQNEPKKSNYKFSPYYLFIWFIDIKDELFNPIYILLLPLFLF